MFREGVAQFEAGRFARAAAIFRQAYKENSSWKLQYNIGQCEAAAKHHGRAMEAFEYYLSMGGDDVPESRRAEVELELDRLRRVVGFINIMAPDGAQISVNGETRGTTPLSGSLMVAAGVVHDVQITLNNEVLLSQKIKLSGTQSVTLETETEQTDTQEQEAAPITPPQIPSEAPPAASKPDDNNSTEPKQSQSHGRLKPIGITLLSTGGAALAAGAVTGIIAFQQSRDLKNNCPDGVCLADYHEDNTTKEHLVTATNILLISGGSIAVAGTVLLIIFHKQKRVVADRASLLPVISTDAFGLMFSKGF